MASLPALEVAVQAYRASDRKAEDLELLAQPLLNCLQDGLKGNRAVSSNAWSVIQAATRAFPIQLSPCTEKAQTILGGSDDPPQLLHTWLLQAAADGSLLVLVNSLRSQPQIATAYARDALVRAPAKLAPLLQQLQAAIPASPFDVLLLQQQSSSAAVQPAAAPIHVETEQDLHRNTQQHDPAAAALPEGPAPAAAAASAGASATSAPSAEPAAAAASKAGPGWMSRQLPKPKAEQKACASSSSSSAAAGAPTTLAGRFLQYRGQAAGSLLQTAQQNKPADATTAAAAGGTTRGVEDAVLKVQLLVVPDPGSSSSSSSDEQPPHLVSEGGRYVRLLLEVLPDSAQQQQQPQQQPGSFLGASATMKGLLQGLQQSAAGGAMAAAISQPFAAVRGMAGSRSVSAKQPATPADAETQGAAQQMQYVVPPTTPQPAQRPGRRTPSFFSRRPGSSTAAAAAADGDDRHAQAGGGDSAATHEQQQDQQQLLRVQLVVSGDFPGAGDGPVSVVFVVSEATAMAGDAEAGAVDAAAAARLGSKGAAGWAAQGLLNRLSIKRSSSSNSSSSKGTRKQEDAAAADGCSVVLAATSSSSGTAADDAASIATDSDLLEGDMWSVMSRLKGAGSTLAANARATPSPAAAASSPTAAAAAASAAEAALAQQLQQQGEQLLEQLLVSCGRVCAAAAATKGSLGDDCPELLQLLALLEQLFNHGLGTPAQAAAAAAAAPSAAAAPAEGNASSSSSSSSRPASRLAAAAAAAGAGAGAAAQGVTATAKGMLGGWLSSKPASAFKVLQLLQHGTKQHARLMLGADGIANMKAARSVSSAARLQLWLRASLNEQLLSCRLSTLVANPAALAAFYRPQALLLQHQLLQPLLQQLAELCSYRYALPVDAAAAAASCAAAAAAAAACGGGGAPAASGSPKSSSSSRLLADKGKQLLGGLTTGLGALGGLVGSGGSTAGSGSKGPAAAAAAGQAAAADAGIPTFLWAAAGSTAAAPAEQPPEQQQGGGLFRRRRGPATVPQIREVRVPPPGSAAVLSPEPSCALSPVSAAGDAEYADWWSPNGSWQDVAAAAVAAAAGSGTGEGSDVPSPLSVEALQALRSRTASGSSLSEAAQRLEQDLAAAMASPMVLGGGPEQRGRRSSSSSAASCGGGAGGRLQQQQQQHLLRRSNSAGWEAAVARARRCSRGSAQPGMTAAQAALYRRSRSPEPVGRDAVAAGTVAVAAAGGGGGGVRRGRHTHKRSSSMNDLPELAALLEAGELLQAGELE